MWRILVSVPFLRTSVLRSRWILYMSSIAILRALVCGGVCMHNYENKKEHIICHIKEKNYCVLHCWWSIWSSDGCKCYLFNALVGAIFLLCLFYKKLFKRHHGQLTYSYRPLPSPHLKPLESFPHPYFAVFQICLLTLTLVSYIYVFYSPHVSVRIWTFQRFGFLIMGFFCAGVFFFVVVFWVIVYC